MTTSNNPFTATLGAGPHKYVGYFSLTWNGELKKVTPARPEKVKLTQGQVGVCAHCGTKLVHIFQVQNAAGDVFGVGSTCILNSFVEWEYVFDVKRDVATILKEQAKIRFQLKLEGSKGDLSRMIATNELVRFPHPYKHYAEEGQTLADYAQWALKFSPIDGIKKVWTLAGMEPKTYKNHLHRLLRG